MNTAKKLVLALVAGSMLSAATPAQAWSWTGALTASGALSSGGVALYAAATHRVGSPLGHFQDVLIDNRLAAPLFFGGLAALTVAVLGCCAFGSNGRASERDASERDMCIQEQADGAKVRDDDKSLEKDGVVLKGFFEEHGVIYRNPGRKRVEGVEVKIDPVTSDRRVVWGDKTKQTFDQKNGS